MKNDLLTIGGLTVHGYGLMIGIGFIAAYLMTEFRARKYRMNTDIVFDQTGDMLEIERRTQDTERNPVSRVCVCQDADSGNIILSIKKSTEAFQIVK